MLQLDNQPEQSQRQSRKVGKRYTVLRATRGRRRLRVRLVAMGLCLGLSACVVPQPTLEKSSEAMLARVDVSHVKNHPEELPLRVRWGGSIVSIDNRPDGHSVVEMVARPLAGSGRPLPADQSSGRFHAEFESFLDPAVYEQGREMTVVGTVTELVDGLIGDMPYRFPLVLVDKSRYWAVREQLPPYRYPYPYYHHYWYDDWPYYHRHRGSRVGGFLILSN